MKTQPRSQAALLMGNRNYSQRGKQGIQLISNVTALRGREKENGQYPKRPPFYLSCYFLEEKVGRKPQGGVKKTGSLLKADGKQAEFS